MSNHLLELKNVTKIFKIGGTFSKNSIKALDSISFDMPLDKPLIMGLVGESGSGKTTLARMILGLSEPTSGEIRYKDMNISYWLKKKRLEYYKEVQPIFQDPYSIYNPFYKIDRNLMLVVKKFRLLPDMKQAYEFISKSLEDIGLRPRDVLGRYPHQLSGGERQRIMLARILLVKPKLIVADEPISMIDVSLKAMFLNYLISFKEKYGISCFFITHDLNTASYVADKILVLCHGRLVEKGPTKDLIENPLHPYTKLLMNSILIPNPNVERKKEIDLTSLESFKKIKAGKGCVFSARCPYATDRCKNSSPELLNVGSERMVACFLYFS
jgi:peptide/nickel transport system ATP-binding protein